MKQTLYVQCTLTQACTVMYNLTKGSDLEIQDSYKILELHNFFIIVIY